MAVDVKQPKTDTDHEDTGAADRRGWPRWTQSKLSWRIGGTVFFLLVGTYWWYVSREDGPTDAELLRQALTLLDDRERPSARDDARQIARILETKEYRDPEFAGGVDFVLGIDAFRSAAELDVGQQEQQYLLASRYLREAERRALIVARRPAWAYALGISLHRVGLASEARPVLQEAVASGELSTSQQVEASMLLTNIYLDLKTDQDLERALQLNSKLVSEPSLTQEISDRAYLQRAQIFLGLRRDIEAEKALQSVSAQESKSQGTVVFRAQTLMAEGDRLLTDRRPSEAEAKYRSALSLLQPIAGEIGLEQTYPREALYLMGVSEEGLGNIAKLKQSLNAGIYDKAINYYERTASRFETSQEGLAANLRAAELLRKTGLHEKALEAYRRALSAVKRPEDYRNRWLSFPKFREMVQAAWNDWIEADAYDEAIALSKIMAPSLPTVQALELTSQAHQRWAEFLEKELETVPALQRDEKEQQTRERWRLSGQAYAELAESLQTTNRYPEALSISAEHFRRGHDFESALAQQTRFLNTQPKKNLMPQALVRRGEILMDLDRLEESISNFQRVMSDYPTDPAAFEAQFLIGKAYFEQNQLDLAEKSWRNILTSDVLTPAAKEWRLALFSLGQLLTHTADLKTWQSEQAIRDGDAPQSEQLLAEAFERLDEAVRWLENYLNRYPNSSEAIPARYLLAKSFQRSADAPRRRLSEAETENARRELQNTMSIALRQARREFSTLQAQLLDPGNEGRLDNVEQRTLQDCFFEIAHTDYALGDYETAIVSYTDASNRYSQDARVLLSYMQMANCYFRLGKTAEALSMLEQARVIHNLQLKPELFTKRTSNWNRDEWEGWLNWARRLRKREPATQ